jgi:hypothetical protein
VLVAGGVAGALAPQRLMIVETSSLARPSALSAQRMGRRKLAQLRSTPWLANYPLSRQAARYSAFPLSSASISCAARRCSSTTGKLSEGVAQCGAMSFYSRVVVEPTKATSFSRPALARAVLQSWQPARPPKQRVGSSMESAPG